MYLQYLYILYFSLFVCTHFCLRAAATPKLPILLYMDSGKKFSVSSEQKAASCASGIITILIWRWLRINMAAVSGSQHDKP